MQQPLFIAIEGLDGSGKSTQVKLLAEKFTNAGHKIYTTAEPTGGPAGKIIRDIFNHRVEGDHRFIAGLFVADRLDHLLNSKEGILKKLEEGYTVITDRYYFSSYAYQGTHMDMNWVIVANSMSATLRRPDLNVFVDVPSEVCIHRLQNARPSMEMYETLENLENVRKKYLEAFELLKLRENIFITDGNREDTFISDDIWKAINDVKDNAES